jgi:hypothetical protein
MIKIQDILYQRPAAEPKVRAAYEIRRREGWNM